MNISINYPKNGNKDEKSILFDIKGEKEYGLNKSIVNSLRRVLLSSIPTVGFKTDMDNSDIKMIKNTTSLHNEYLLHRLSLIPLYINPEDYKKNYLFKLKVESSPDKPIIKVTAKDFQIFPLKEGINIDENENTIDLENYSDKEITETEKEKMFRPFQNKFYCEITELKTTKSELKEALELYAVPRISVAYEDARWQAVSCATYSFKRDEELFKTILNEKIKINNIPEEEKYKFSKSLYISESERFYHRDVNCEPYWYEFKVDSIHYLSSKELFIKACDILIQEIELFKKEIPKISTAEENSRVAIEQESENLYKVFVHGSDDTFGNIMQTHIVNHIINEIDTDFVVCGYKKPHPLENYLIFNLSIGMEVKKSNEHIILSIVELFTNAAEQLINIFLMIKSSAEENL